MFEVGEGLPFNFKTTEDLPGVDTGLENFEGDFATDQAGLVGAVNDPESAFANLGLQFDAFDLRGAGLTF